MVTNIDYDAQKTHKFLSNSFAVNRAIRTILQRCKQDHCYGVQIDFESIAIRDYGVLNHFYKKIILSFHQAGFAVSFAVAPLATHNPYQFHFLKGIYQNIVSNTKNSKASADFISIMTYDEHCQGTKPGPNASIVWVDEAVRLALNYLPPEKISLGIPDYSYLWYTDARRSLWSYQIKKSVSSLSFDNVYDVMRNKHFHLKWDNDQKVDYATYRDGLYSEYLYVEDAHSFAAKLALAQKYHLRGVSIFRLGLEDPRVWGVLSRYEKRTIHS